MKGHLEKLQISPFYFLKKFLLHWTTKCYTYKCIKIGYLSFQKISSSCGVLICKEFLKCWYYKDWPSSWLVFFCSQIKILFKYLGIEQEKDRRDGHREEQENVNLLWIMDGPKLALCKVLSCFHVQTN